MAQVNSPGTIAATQLCELTGLTDRRHRQLAEEGYFPPPIRGLYKAAPTIKGLFRYFTEQINKKDDSLAAERKKLTRAKRETAEEDLAIKRNQYVKKSEIGPALRDLAVRQKALLRRKLETELAEKLPAKFRPALAAAVDEICGLMRGLGITESGKQKAQD